MQYVAQQAPARRLLLSSTSLDPIGAEAIERTVQSFEVQPAIEEAKPLRIRRTNRHANRPLHNGSRDHHGDIRDTARSRLPLPRRR